MSTQKYHESIFSFLGECSLWEEDATVLADEGIIEDKFRDTFKRAFDNLNSTAAENQRNISLKLSTKCAIIDKKRFEFSSRICETSIIVSVHCFPTSKIRPKLRHQGTCKIFNSSPLILGVFALSASLSIPPIYPPNHLYTARSLTLLTALVAYISTLLWGLIVWSLLYYMPLYSEVTKNYSLITFGITISPFTFIITLITIIISLIIIKTSRYKPLF